MGELKNVGISSRALLSELETRPWSTLGPSTGSNESLGKIHGWISCCQANHKQCGSTHGYHGPPGLEIGTFFPTRVIDVEKADAGIISLRDRAEVMIQFGTESEARLPTSTESSTVHKYPVYWTLSHRWGNTDEMPRLLKDTELRLREGVKLNELPPINRTWPAFRDAALLVKRLGYRYIWIDSLCIFQDSASEWQQEAITMIDIYRHSYCNISAGSASHNPANNGLFRRRKLHERLFYPVVVNINAQPYWAWHILDWENEVERAPLNKRGWVVQERFLTTRTIHFAKSQIFWECLEEINRESQTMSGSLASLESLRAMIMRDADSVEGGKKAALEFTKLKEASLKETSQKETSLKSHRRPHDEGRLERIYKYRRNIVGYFKSRGVLKFDKPKEITTELHPSPRLVRIYEEWTRIVEYYTSCRLTNESDRLIALSGIAKAFQETTGDTYLAGLWKDALVPCLAWHTGGFAGVQVRRNEYAPSWSWASITGGMVSFSVVGRWDRTPNYAKLIKERIIPKSANGDSFGLLCSAELDVECMICHLRLGEKRRYPRREAWVYYDEAHSRCFFEGDSYMTVRYDSADLANKHKVSSRSGSVPIITFIPIGRDAINICCLILERDVDNRFKRVGLMSWELEERETSFLDKWDGTKSRITLI
ncbi:HET-domain-containing protein [Daldinia decipiens]|uniref:HET-domain-containing protein n=1 Tax=Daldinia decipiens TaxID=326647 RepID=UPI0020C4E814|nr:HET-domain-containing protein [Daldinia decipiens]KAI1660233.1 HET-domain-containing protein [Daldinia decipiens]